MSAIKKVQETERPRALGRIETLPYDGAPTDEAGGTLPPPRRAPHVDTDAPTQPEILGAARASLLPRRDKAAARDVEPRAALDDPQPRTGDRPGPMTLPGRREAPTVPGRRAIAPPPLADDLALGSLDAEATSLRHRPPPPALRRHDSLTPEMSGRYSVVYKRRSD